MELTHYRLKINPDLVTPERVYAMGFVDEPAIERGWMAFKNEPIGAARMHFKTDTADQMIVTGPMMIPDKVILRKDYETDEYFVVSASREDIRQCREKFATLGYHNTSNVNHFDPSFGMCTMVEHWEIEDFQMDKAKALGFEELPAGTWMGTWKVRDAALWAKIKSGELTGFSIEGWFDLIETPAPVSVKAKTEFSNMNGKPKQSFGKFMLKQIAALFGAGGKMLMADHVLKDGTKIQIDDETGEVFLIDAEGNRGEKAPDATHELDSGELLVVYNGIAVLTTTSHLAASIETAIQVLITGGKTRDEVLADITTATELTAADISSILAGTFGCMVMEKRDLLATTLGIAVDDLKAAATMDGCTDEVEEVEEVDLSAEALMRREAFQKGFKAAHRIQLSKESKVFKLGKQVKAQAEMLEDGNLIYIMVDSGRVYNVGADLWLEDYAAPGTYTTMDGKTIVVVEQEIIFDEGTEWEWSYTVSVVDYNASTLTVEDYLPWVGEVTEVAAQAAEAMKATHAAELSALNTKMSAETKAKDEAAAKFKGLQTELEKVKTELSEISNRPIAPGPFGKVKMEATAKTTPPRPSAAKAEAAMKILQKQNSEK